VLINHKYVYLISYTLTPVCISIFTATCFGSANHRQVFYIFSCISVLHKRLGVGVQLGPKHVVVNKLIKLVTFYIYIYIYIYILETVC